jgi:hypothetical protein
MIDSNFVFFNNSSIAQIILNCTIIGDPDLGAGEAADHGFCIFVCDRILNVRTLGFKVFPPFAIGSG